MGKLQRSVAAIDTCCNANVCDVECTQDFSANCVAIHFDYILVFWQLEALDSTRCDRLSSSCRDQGQLRDSMEKVVATSKSLRRTLVMVEK